MVGRNCSRVMLYIRRSQPAAVSAPLGVARGASARVRRGGGARVRRGGGGAVPGPRRRRLPGRRAARRRAQDRQGALQGQVSIMYTVLVVKTYILSLNKLVNGSFILRVNYL